MSLKQPNLPCGLKFWGEDGKTNSKLLKWYTCTCILGCAVLLHTSKCPWNINGYTGINICIMQRDIFCGFVFYSFKHTVTCSHSPKHLFHLAFVPFSLSIKINIPFIIYVKNEKNNILKYIVISNSSILFYVQNKPLYWNIILKT